MKKDYSKTWKQSKQPRKQRKYRARAPLHVKHKFLGATLDKALRKKYQKKSFPVRKGDTVKIMRGAFKGKTGKIERIDAKRARASIEKIQRTKKDGTKVEVFFNASNLQIKELNLEDKERIKSIEKKTKKTKEKK
jgi:large subunit ribosomal protein L24